MTSLSMPIMENLRNVTTLPHTIDWTVGIVSGSLISSIIGYTLNFMCDSQYQHIPWFHDSEILNDETDSWKINTCRGNFEFMKAPTTIQNYVHRWCYSLKLFAILVCFATYLVAFSLHVFLMYIFIYYWSDTSHINIIGSIMSCIVIEIFGFIYLCRSVFQIPNQSVQANYFNIPYQVWLCASYVLTCSLQHYYHKNLKNARVMDLVGENVESMCTHTISVLIFVDIIYLTIYMCIKSKFILNIYFINHGIRKILRVLDTLASIFLLTGLVVGIASIFIEQYDVVFIPDGFAKDILYNLEKVQDEYKFIMSRLKNIIDSLDLKITCENVYQTATTSAVLGLISLLFPQTGPIVSIGSRGAYYITQLANGLTNFASRLKRVNQHLWRIVLFIKQSGQFAAKHFTKITIASNSLSICSILILLPPCIYGVYILFGAFWPKKIIFFSTKQRKKHMSECISFWIKALILLSVACLINSFFLNEIVQLMDENLGLVKVKLEHQLGWKMAMSASALALIGSFLKLTIALILLFQTNNNDITLTNSEQDWRNELERRELVVILTAYGDKIQKRTHLKYKQSRMSPWTWIVPIILTLIACSFCVLANFHSKLNLTHEPKGIVGRFIEKIYSDVVLFKTDMDHIENELQMECFILTSLRDVFRDNGNFEHMTMFLKPIQNFKNITNQLISPLNDSVTSFKRQLLADVNNEIFGEHGDNFWQQSNHLQYIGLLVTIPRFICLFILVTGFFMACCFMCTNTIFESFEPKNLVDAFGQMSIFSLVYVIGTQLSIFNILSSFGLPFFHINVKFGTGFVYDLVADAIILATYIGMKNELFFAIPKKQTIVTYSIPKVSDEGENVYGQVI